MHILYTYIYINMYIYIYMCVCVYIYICTHILYVHTNTSTLTQANVPNYLPRESGGPGPKVCPACIREDYTHTHPYLYII